MTGKLLWLSWSGNSSLRKGEPHKYCGKHFKPKEIASVKTFRMK